MCQCPPVCSQALSGTGPSAPRSRRIASRRRRAASTRSSSLGSAACRLRCEHELVGARPAWRGGARRRLLEARSRGALPQDVADAAPPRFEPGQLLEHGRRRLAQPEELRVAVRQARAGDAALVEHDLDVREPFGATPPGGARTGPSRRPRPRAPPARPASGRAAACARRPPAARAPGRGSGRRGPASRECPVGLRRAERAYVSGGVRSSRPSQNGHSSSSAWVGSGSWGGRLPAAAPGQARSRPFVLRSGLA